MRLFVASEIDRAVADAVGAFGGELRTRASVLAPAARITWVPVDRAHITVRFIGEVDEVKASVIAAALKPTMTSRPFELTVGGVGAFPKSGPPRVFWVGLAGGLQALSDVEQDVSARLALCGIARDDRPYRPHLTLARVRDAAGLRTRSLLEGVADRAFGVTRVDAITLFESRLSPKGPAYVPLQTTPLSGPTCPPSRSGASARPPGRSAKRTT